MSRFSLLRSLRRRVDQERNHRRRRLFVESLEGRRLLAGDPGFPYVDANNDAQFNVVDGDVLLDDGELNDGFFDTAIPEGPDYVIAIPGAGLGIHGAAISKANLNFSADGEVVINTDLTATSGNLLVTSRDGSVSLDDPTLKAKFLLEIDAEGSIYSEDDRFLGTGPSSVIRFDAGDEIELYGTVVDAKKQVSMEAFEIYIGASPVNPSTVTANPNTIGNVYMSAFAIDVDAEVTARKDIVMEAVFLDVSDSVLTANGHGLGKIDLQGLLAVDASYADIVARKEIVIEAAVAIDELLEEYEGIEEEWEIIGEFGGLVAQDAFIQAIGSGTSSVTLLSHSFVDIFGSYVEARQLVSVEALNGFADVSWAALIADFHSQAKVSVVAAGDGELVEGGFDYDEGGDEYFFGGGADIFADGSLIVARQDVVLDAAGSVVAHAADIEAIRPLAGKIDIDAGFDAVLHGSVLQAGAGIAVDVGESIHANDAFFHACDRASSTVTMSAANSIFLEGSSVRANLLIDLLAGDVVDVRDASLGISRAGVGDIVIEADSIEVDGAVLKAPDDLILLGTMVGTPADDSPGTLPCEDIDGPIFLPD